MVLKRSPMKETPGQMRLRGQLHAALTENLSIHNLARVATLRKALRGADLSGRTSAPMTVSDTMGRKHARCDLYLQSSWSLLDAGKDSVQGRLS